MSTLQVSEDDANAEREDLVVTPRDDPPLSDGIKAALPFVLPTLAIGMSFGVLAEPVMGAWAAIAMSILVFGGAAQFGSVSILAAGGGLASAVSAGLLINTRFLPMGFAVAPALKGGPFRRAVEAQTMVDASWAIANRGDGTFEPQSDDGRHDPAGRRAGGSAPRSAPSAAPCSATPRRSGSTRSSRRSTSRCWPRR